MLCLLSVITIPRVPTEGLALCPQPYNNPDKFGTHPYTHSQLYVKNF